MVLRSPIRSSTAGPAAARRGALPPWPLPCLLLALALLGAVSVSASSGDRLDVFRQCVSACAAQPCALLLPLRALRWTCASDCAYRCAHDVTALSDAGALPRHHQFFGKWAFHRVLGVQEPLSVLFSLGNLWAHVRGLRAVARAVGDGNALKPWLNAAAYIQINTWVWSAVFHTRGESPPRRRTGWPARRPLATPADAQTSPGPSGSTTSPR